MGDRFYGDAHPCASNYRGSGTRSLPNRLRLDQLNRNTKWLLSIHPGARIASAGILSLLIKRCDLDRRFDAHRLERLLHDTPDNLGKTPGSWGSSRLIPVPPCDPNTTTTFIDLPKSCFIPDQPQCDLTHLETKWLCWSNQSYKSLQRLTGQIQLNHYASNLIIGFSPNRWNSLTMIILTTSALSGVVRIESWIVAINVPGSSSRILRQMTSIMILDS